MHGLDQRDETILDSLGPWSQRKHDILQKYAEAFTTITGAHHFRRIYVDGFAGAGMALSRTSQQAIACSPLRALDVRPGFDAFHLVELDRQRASSLRARVADDPRVTVHQGDCNTILPDTILPRVRYEEYARALCLLDPFGLHLHWRVVETAAATRAADVLINLPVHDINRNIKREGAAPAQEARMTAFWGDESWRQVLHTPAAQLHLFGEDELNAASNDDIARAYAVRLRQEAGFGHVAQPIPMRNSRNAIIYYLVFASHQPVAVRIIDDIACRFAREDRMHGPYSHRVD